VAETTLEVMLAANRCLELLVPGHLVDRLFGGWRVWAWIALPLGYGLYIAVCQKAAAFTGVLFAWVFIPHYGYMDPVNSSQPVIAYSNVI
jgi:hypothetical protein